MKRRTVSLALSLLMLFSLAAPAAAGCKGTEGYFAAEMTVEQKVAQMLMPAFRRWRAEDGTAVSVTACNETIADAIAKYGFGGVILFAENTQGAHQTAELIAQMQSAAACSENGIPLMLAVDQEGGTVYRLGTGTALCGNMALGAAGDTALTQKAASLIGNELAAQGFHIDFAPVLDVNNDPANPVIGLRSFSDDPAAVAAQGAAFIAGLRGEGIASALKHFPGHGDTKTDSHSGLPCIDKSLEELEKCELIPFRAGIGAGAQIVMTAHIQYPQIEQETYRSVSTGEDLTLPATLSKTILTGLLREKLGFSGLICTDALTMSAIAEHFDPLDTARLAINAGADLLLMPMTIESGEDLVRLGDYIAGIAAMVRAGEIDEKMLDAAVERILAFKETQGIFGRTAPDEAALDAVGSQEHHAIEWEITKQTITAVRDNGMPRYAGKVAAFVAYENEKNAAEYAVAEAKLAGVLPRDAVCSVFCYQKLRALDETMCQAIRSADIVLANTEFSAGGSLNAADDKGWQAAFLDDLIAKTHEAGKKVAVISCQLPYDLVRYEAADLLLAAYNPKGMSVYPAAWNGEVTAYGPNLPAAFYAALGGFAPTGKLPVDLPKLDENGVFIDEIAYPRGYSAGVEAPLFTDVAADDWCYEAVAYCLKNGIMYGTGDGAFSPDAPATRAMIWTILERMSGGEVGGETWMEDARAWAMENGISDGTDPEGNITREQFAAMLYRVVQKEGGGFTGAWVFPLTAPDAREISAWADEAMHWCVMKKIIGGDETGFYHPAAFATRAEVTQILMNFLRVREAP